MLPMRPSLIRRSAVLVAIGLLVSVAVGAEVPVNGDTFTRQEVSHLLGNMEKERLVSYSKLGTLTLADPSAEVTNGINALGEQALSILSVAYPAASDGVKYGIARILAANEKGQRILSRVVRDRRIRGRRWIVSALTGVYTAVTVPCFRDLCIDPDRDVAEGAIFEMGRCEDDQGVRVLRTLLRVNDRTLARKAAQALASRKDASGYPLLLEALNSTRELPLRLTLISSLGTSGSAEAVASLVRIFATAAAHVQDAEPLPSMSKLYARPGGSQVTPSMRAMFEASYAANALTGLNRRGPRPEVTRLLTHGNPRIRRMAVEVLGSCADATAVAALREAMAPETAEAATDEGEEGLTLVIAQALRQIGGVEARAALEGAWKTNAGSTRAALSLCLAALDHPGGLKAAVNLAQSGSQQMRIAAVSALGFSRSGLAFQTLSSLMESPDTDIRLLAASSLSQPGNVAAQAPLLSLLSAGEATEDPQSLSVAALGLGLAGDEKSVKSLERLLLHKNPSVRRAAAVGLFYITGKSRTYVNMWGLEGTFEPTTFHRRLREEKLARLGPR
jgi:HEAT repeat protein